VSLLFNYLSSESRIKRFIDCTEAGMTKSVKSINLCKSVIQTNYDIVKAHGGELKMETKEEGGTEFVIQLNN